MYGSIVFSAVGSVAVDSHSTSPNVAVPNHLLFTQGNTRAKRYEVSRRIYATGLLDRFGGSSLRALPTFAWQETIIAASLTLSHWPKVLCPDRTKDRWKLVPDNSTGIQLTLLVHESNYFCRKLDDFYRERRFANFHDKLSASICKKSFYL